MVCVPAGTLCQLAIIYLDRFICLRSGAKGSRVSLSPLTLDDTTFEESQGAARGAHKRTHGCTRGTHGYTRGTQGVLYAGVLYCTQGYCTQGYSTTHRGTQGYTGVHRGTQGCTYTGVQRSAQAETLDLLTSRRA